jgi:hypothetical protein
MEEKTPLRYQTHRDAAASGRSFRNNAQFEGTQSLLFFHFVTLKCMKIVQGKKIFIYLTLNITI